MFSDIRTINHEQEDIMAEKIPKSSVQRNSSLLRLRRLQTKNCSNGWIPMKMA